MPHSGALELTMVQPAHCAPDDTIVYAIGDIHGCADLLNEMHELIRKDADSVKCNRRVLVYLGDYVDRGPDSKKVVDLILDNPLPEFETSFLMGNHEEFLIDFLTDVEAGPGWLFNGGHTTLQSYGVKIEAGSDLTYESLGELQQDFVAKLSKEHRDFYEGLELCRTEGDYFFVHAGVRPGIPLINQSDEDMLWIRDEFLNSSDDFGKMIVHGHTISWEPEFRGNRIGIDTGAFTSGVLTAIALEGHEQEILRVGTA